MDDLLDWSRTTAEIGDKGLAETRSADGAERARVAKALDLLAVDRLDAAYSVRPRGKTGYLLKGKVTADVSQACVVTLEPVPATVEAQFSVLFKPDADGRSDLDFDPVAEEDEPEALEHGRIAIGRIVCEHLAAAIDPYPRKADAAFNYVDPATGDGGKSSPFAALDKLRRKE